MARRLEIDINDWRGRVVVDGSQRKVGKITDLYVDERTGQPSYAVVQSGLLTKQTYLVPVDGADPAGREIRVPVGKAEILEEPSVAPDAQLPRDAEAQLARHFGREPEFTDAPPTPPRGDAHGGRQADAPHELPARGWKDVLTRVVHEMKDDKLVLVSAGAAFFAMLAIFPAMVAAISIYGFFANPASAQQLVSSATATMPPAARDLITSQLQTMLSGHHAAEFTTAAVVGIVLALWSASSGMRHLIDAINDAYGETETRKFLKLRGLSLLLTIGGLVFAGVAAFLVGAVPSLARSAGLGSAATTVARVAVWILLAAGFAAGLAVLYRYGPDRDEPRWRWVSWGAVVATVIWILASVGLTIYTTHFGSYNKTYGSLAAVVILMLWLLLSALAILVGAEINSELEHQTVKDTTRGPREPMGERDAYAADTVGETAEQVKAHAKAGTRRRSRT